MPPKDVRPGMVEDMDLAVVDAIDSLTVDRSGEVHVPREQVLSRLCQVCTSVMVHSDAAFPADCFCGPPKTRRFLFDERVIAFVEAAVREKIETEERSRREMGKAGS